MADNFKPIALTHRRNRHPYPHLNQILLFLLGGYDGPYHRRNWIYWKQFSQGVA